MALQTARLTKRPLIHTDEGLDTNPAKRATVLDKAAIAADKENSQAKKAAGVAVLAPRATQTKPAPLQRAALSDITTIKPSTKDVAPPTKSLTSLVPVPAKKAALSSAVHTLKKSVPVTVLDLSLHDASNDSLEPMLIDAKIELPAGVIDIDAVHINDPRRVAEYAPDIYEFYFQKEKEVAPAPNYMQNHPDLRPEMRAQLIDWLLQVHMRLIKTGDAFFLNVWLIDRFLSINKKLRRENFQLLGAACLFIASKIEEVNALCLQDVCQMCDKTREEITKMESFVLSTLSFNVMVPTSLHFVRRFILAVEGFTAEEHAISRYILDSSLMSYEILAFLPSMIAASSLYLAKRLVADDPDVWTPTLAYYSKYEEAQLLPCATALNEMLKRRPTVNFSDANQVKTLPTVQRKYLSKQYGRAALIQPLDEL